MKTRLGRKLAVGVLLVALLLTTTACGEMDSAYIAELVSIFLPEVISYGLLGTSGDQSLDAIFESAEVLDQVDAADALMEEGWRERDPAIMEDAIAMRPGDPTYRRDAAELYWIQGSFGPAEKHLDQAQEAVKDNPRAAKEHNLSVIDKLDNRKTLNDQWGYKSLDECQFIHMQLIKHYDRVWALEGNTGVSPAANTIASEGLRCRDLVKP
ncbi:MAG: hypothetical protein FJ026_11440 [Chloroflexi bacterium]|nr:hypothetical protein [Chloroflexota bacterium]